ncbi:TetR/AcrR family transcriptional regulator [Sphingobacterium lactis]|uniref:TetR/AcrR family transcriptional regulator n=1 Tax=Sphingobacterium TaxID=28453 RepID=UPI002897DFFB|nr:MULTISPECIES: TetR/AcrR family transcriptional regulator [Sphingobacterium]
MPRNREFDYDEKLEIVRDLFWEKGYHGTSMHDIVDTMQLNRSSIYSSFGNKHDLFLKCLSNYAQLKTAQYRNAADQETISPFQALAHTIRDVIDQTIKDKKSCLIIRTIFELGDSDQEVNKLIIANAIVLEKIFVQLIQKAEDAGEISKSVPSKIKARYILSSFSGLYKHYVISGNRKEVDELIDFLIDSLKH